MKKNIIKILTISLCLFILSGCKADKPSIIASLEPTENPPSPKPVSRLSKKGKIIIDYKNAIPIKNPTVLKDCISDGIYEYTIWSETITVAPDGKSFFAKCNIEKSGSSKYYKTGICKASFTGTVEWHKPLSDSEQYFNGNELYINSDALFSLSERSPETEQGKFFSKCFLNKTSFSGDIIWKKKLDVKDTKNEYWTILYKQMCDDGVFLFLKRNMVNSNDDFIYKPTILQKYDYEGELIWQKEFDFYNLSKVHSLIVQNGNIHILYNENDGESRCDVYWMKLDSFGNLEWKNILYSEQGNDVWPNPYLFGKEDGILMSACEEKDTKNSLGSVYLINYNSDGAKLWEKEYRFPNDGAYLDYNYLNRLKFSGGFYWGDVSFENEKPYYECKYLCQFDTAGNVSNLYMLETGQAFIALIEDNIIILEEDD